MTSTRIDLVLLPISSNYRVPTSTADILIQYVRTRGERKKKRRKQEEEKRGREQAEEIEETEEKEMNIFIPSTIVG